jgi:hypothetical protein
VTRGQNSAPEGIEPQFLGHATRRLNLRKNIISNDIPAETMQAKSTTSMNVSIFHFCPQVIINFNRIGCGPTFIGIVVTDNLTIVSLVGLLAHKLVA